MFTFMQGFIISFTIIVMLQSARGYFRSNGTLLMEYGCSGVFVACAVTLIEILRTW